MRKKSLGYIVASEYFFGEVLELCNDENHPWPVLLRADVATVFSTRGAAKRAIEKTIEWAKIREEQDEALRPLEWADKDKYKIWRLCPAVLAEKEG